MDSTPQEKLRLWLKTEGRKSMWLADRVPISPKTISSWLTGRGIPTPPSRARLADITGIEDLTSEEAWEAGCIALTQKSQQK